jgi:hypothetical protein
MGRLQTDSMVTRPPERPYCPRVKASGNRPLAVRFCRMNQSLANLLVQARRLHHKLLFTTPYLVAALVKGKSNVLSPSAVTSAAS